jgi:hypothetical protein
MHMEILGAKWTDVLQCLITAGGFVFVWSQIKLLRQSTAGSTYASLYGEYMDVCKLFLEKPQLRPYFYHPAAGAPEMPDGGEARQTVEVMCELMTGLLEHATLQQGNIPANIWEQCWKKYTNDRFNESPAMRSYWELNRHLYADAFRKVVDERKRSIGTAPS